MGLGRAISGVSWLWKLNRAASAIEKEGRMYDVKVTLVKGAKALAITAGAVALNAALLSLADTATLEHALGPILSPVLRAALIPVIAGAAHSGLNWLKNRP